MVLKRLIYIFILLFLFLAAAYTRTLIESARYLDKARNAYAQNRTLESIDMYRSAIAWRSPFNTASESAIEELKQLSVSEKLSPNERLEALEQLKRGLRSSRSWLHPESYQDENSETSKAATALPPDTYGIKEQVSFDLRYGSLALSHLFFVGWALSVVVTIWRSSSSNGIWNLAKLRKGIGVFIVFYALWLWMLAAN